MSGVQSFQKNNSYASYQNIYNNKPIIDSYEAMKSDLMKTSYTPDEILENMKKVSDSISDFVRKRNYIRENLNFLNTKKQKISDLLDQFIHIENKYRDLYKENDLLYNNKLLCPDVIGNKNPFVVNTDSALLVPDVYSILCNTTFLINKNYVENMCNILSDIEKEIASETVKYDEAQDFVNTYTNFISANMDTKFASNIICPICFNEKVDQYLQPCGHTYCGECIKKVTNRCFSCNQTVTKKSRLFFTEK